MVLLNRKTKTILGLVFVIVLFLYQCSHKWTSHSNTTNILTQQPLQAETSKASFIHNDFVIKPVATIDIQARVLSRRHYWFGKEKQLAPIDLALGWGRMSDSEILKHFVFTQFNRWYHYTYFKKPPIPKMEVVSSSANMHLIPANVEIAKEIQNVRKGDVVDIQGWLVDVNEVEGKWKWLTSKSRTDTGQGACEIIWVQRINVLK